LYFRAPYTGQYFVRSKSSFQDAATVVQRYIQRVPYIIKQPAIFSLSQ